MVAKTTILFPEELSKKGKKGETPWGVQKSEKKEERVKAKNWEFLVLHQRRGPEFMKESHKGKAPAKKGKGKKAR